MSHKGSRFDENSNNFLGNSAVNRHILKPDSSSSTFGHHRFPLTSKSDPVNYRTHIPDLNKKVSNLSNLFNRNDSENGENAAFPCAHFNTIRKLKQFPSKEFKCHDHNQDRKQSSNLNNHDFPPAFRQKVMAGDAGPSLARQGNVTFTTADEKEARDKELTNALQMISQSMEPPQHNVDKYRVKILSYLRPREGEAGSVFYRFCEFLSGYPFYIYRAFWHYVILEIHLFYNLALLFASFFFNPPLGLFVVGIILFWFRIIYELYRDIMHRDDALYASNVPKQLSLSAAISASIGFIIRMKSQDGLITEAWWSEPW